MKMPALLKSISYIFPKFHLSISLSTINHQILNLKLLLKPLAERTLNINKKKYLKERERTYENSG